MEKLLNYGDEYLQQSTWKDLALIKLCLWAMGIMWGMTIPKKAQKQVACIAAFVFVLTYVPIMIKFFRVISNPTVDEL